VHEESRYRKSGRPPVTKAARLQPEKKADADRKHPRHSPKPKSRPGVKRTYEAGFKGWDNEQRERNQATLSHDPAPNFCRSRRLLSQDPGSLNQVVAHG
jgi:hypothetical protein